MYVVAINSRVYTKRTIYLLISIAYIYVSIFDLLHLVTFESIRQITSNLNHSYQYFFAARLFEAVSVFLIFAFVKGHKANDYRITHIISSVIFLAAVLFVQLGMAPEYFRDSGVKTIYFNLFTYFILIFYLIDAFYINRKSIDKNEKQLLVIVFIVKALSMVILANSTKISDVFSVVAVMLQFISYAGLYLVFIRQTVLMPYQNVYKLFETKEQELISLSQTDSLTGLYNHSLTFQKIEEAIRKIGFEYKELCVILFDIDNFKQINDSFGHMKGDEMLLEVTRIFGEKNVTDQIVGRYGGDEFVMALPDYDEAHINSLFENFQKKYDEVAERTGIRITFSAGIVVWKMGDNATDLIRKADIKMYQAKNKGKNQFAIWQQEYDTKKVTN